MAELRTLAELTIDSSRDVKSAACAALAQHEQAASSVEAEVLKGLRQTLVDCDYALVDVFSATLNAILDSLG